MLTTRAENPLRIARQLHRQGEVVAALELLRDCLRRGHLRDAQVDSVGRFLQRSFDGDGRDMLSVVILGQCTTAWTAHALRAEAWAHGVPATVEHGEYDSVIQQLDELRKNEKQPDALVLLPWHQRLLNGEPRGYEARLRDELAFWKQAWAMIPGGTRLVQIGYDVMHSGPDGYQVGSRASGTAQIVREMNRSLCSELPGNAYFVDLAAVAGELGRRQFYDARNYAWTRQPFSTVGVNALSRHIWAGIRAVTTGPKKVLVLDLDNTLWGGVVAELGPHEIQLGDSPDGEAFRNFQRHVKELASQGVLLAVCSKNNLDDALEPFSVNGDMLLSRHDFACFEASWDAKSVAIQRIADTLRLGLDSFVFFDDNPVEREEVLQQLPDVAVVDVPADPAEYVRTLSEGLWFESVGHTDADRQRGAQYRAELHRRAEQEASKSLSDYLESLQMRAVVTVFNDRDMQRVTQLLAKTNQFNLTTRRHTRQDVRRLLSIPGAIGLTLRMTDRFGDYGLVSLVIAVPDKTDPQSLLIDTWLMSCRAIGRSVEYAMLTALLQAAKNKGYRCLVGEYIPTRKNQPVAEFFPKAGFSPMSSTGEAKKFSWDLCSTPDFETFVQLESE